MLLFSELLCWEDAGSLLVLSWLRNEYLGLRGVVRPKSCISLSCYFGVKKELFCSGKLKPFHLKADSRLILRRSRLFFLLFVAITTPKRCLTGWSGIHWGAGNSPKETFLRW